MAHERLSRAQSRERTVERLLEAATDVFEEKGYTRASLSEIAARAGYTKGAVYANFANKETLFATVHLMRNADTTTDLREAVERAGDVHALIRILNAWNTRTIGRNVTRMRLDGEFWLLAERNDAMRDAVAETFTQGTVDTALLIEREAERLGASLTLGPHQAAELLVAVVYGLQTQARFDPQILDSDVFANALALVLGVASRPT